MSPLVTVLLSAAGCGALLLIGVVGWLLRERLAELSQALQDLRGDTAALRTDLQDRTLSIETMRAGVTAMTELVKDVQARLREVGTTDVGPRPAGRVA